MNIKAETKMILVPGEFGGMRQSPVLAVKVTEGELTSYVETRLEMFIDNGKTWHEALVEAFSEGLLAARILISDVRKWEEGLSPSVVQQSSSPPANSRHD